MAAPVTVDSRVLSPGAGPSASTSRQSIATPGHQAAEAHKAPNPSKMTKAQRRELQERQRAAKAQGAAAKAQEEKGGVKGKGAEKVVGAQGRARRGTTSGDAPPVSAGRAAKENRESTLGDDATATRGLRIFSHFGQPKPPSSVKGDIHPAVIRLGLQFSTFKITGANARCIATLNTFKTVIQDYSTPPNTTLSRHLMTHLNPQINHIVSSRPLAVTMGNAIRQLKLEISDSDIDLPEQDAKDAICRKIDNYIRDRIIIADQVIQDTAGQKIKDGDVILTFARSSVVEKVLLCAREEGKQFSVVVVDSRPMLEGKHLLSVLAAADIPCTYLMLPALGSVITEVSTVILGAHSLHADGAVYARAGTALVAMLAKKNGVPVLVCCETYKFTDSVILDGFTKNELAPSGMHFETFPQVVPADRLTLQPLPNLEILNPLYDLTPPANITAVVTEVGIVPPNSISSIPLALGRQIT